MSDVTDKVAEMSVEEKPKASTSAPVEDETPHPSGMSLDERVELALSCAEECIQPEELRMLFAKKPEPRCYDGFEPSGRMHIAQGILKSLIVNKLTKCGCRFIFWVADWFAMLNNKMGGDLKKIKNVGLYMIEVWKAVGMDMDKVDFLWASEEINKRPAEYWGKVMDIAMKNNLTRVIKCSQIMGRGEKDDLSAAQIFYPCMQCADIFFLKADICQLGLDQRKVNMLAREYCDQIKMKFKPVVLSHPMMPGLKQGMYKMSKSDPDSAIFMEDSEMDVNSKIKKAYCPPGIIEENPCLDYMKHIVLPSLGSVTIERSDDNGGNVTYDKYEQMEDDFKNEKLHPGDLKPCLAKAINKLIQPVRDHFKNNPDAAKLLKTVKSYKTTR
eukprot:GFYU01001407.1.p2 GENE.GFYU01001407.1~~GFYU01001407.1.p2  ORF type:complete len:384 (+),score=162.75 GFYU01001407.1:120-1271(+)